MTRYYIVLFFVLASCSTDGEFVLGTLESALAGKEVVRDNVIACAANNEDNSLINVFYYPRELAENVRYFETETADVDKNDFLNYTEFVQKSLPVFNGYLRRFEVESNQEKWVVVSFEEGDKIHISNPIRLKQKTKPTEFLVQNVTIDSSSNMPTFVWEDGSYTDTEIYFEVVSDAAGNLHSGTYTYDKRFQYYNLDNVVLNITKTSPPVLKSDTPYNFTLMGVSEDNWVNLFSEIKFVLN